MIRSILHHSGLRWHLSTLLWMIRKYFIREYDDKVNSASLGLEMASFHFTLDDKKVLYKGV